MSEGWHLYNIIAQSTSSINYQCFQCYIDSGPVNNGPGTHSALKYNANIQACSFLATHASKKCKHLLKGEI